MSLFIGGFCLVLLGPTFVVTWKFLFIVLYISVFLWNISINEIDISCLMWILYFLWKLHNLLSVLIIFYFICKLDDILFYLQECIRKFLMTEYKIDTNIKSIKKFFAIL